MTTPPRPTGPPLPTLQVPPDLKVEYANFARIAHSTSELVFDFAHLLPGENPARVNTRLVMSPLGAKMFCRALIENLARYEAAFGEIPIPGDTSLADNLFRPSNPPSNPPQG